jgi:hypothetical protein
LRQRLRRTVGQGKFDRMRRRGNATGNDKTLPPDPIHNDDFEYRITA